MSIPLGDTQVLVFEIPYGIRVEDGFQFEEQEDQLEINIPPAEGGAEVGCRLGDVFARLRFCQIVNSEGIHFKGPFTIEGERLGRSLSSVVLIHFSDEFMEAIPQGVLEGTPANYHEQGTIMGSDLATPLDKHLIVWGMNFLNKFLSYYRFFENEYWVTSLTPQMVQKFHLWRANGETLDRHRIRRWTGGPAKGGPANLEAIEQGTLSTDPMNLIQTLRLDSRENISRSDFSEGIIQAAQFVELWSIYAFVIIAKEHGFSEEEAVSEISHEERFYSIKNIFDHYNSKFEFDFKATDEYEAWKRDTKQVRDRVVHKGHIPSRKEAKTAYEAAMAAVYRIQKTFEEELRNGKIEDYPETDLLGSNILITKESE